MKARKIPMRLCLGCQQQRPKRELVRIVRSPEGAFSVDATGKKPGRGAYICPCASCFDQARKRRGIERSFETRIDPALYDALAAEVRELERRAQIASRMPSQGHEP